MGIAPHDGAEQALSVLCADGDEIRTWLAVVKASQAILFAIFLHGIDTERCPTA